MLGGLALTMGGLGAGVAYFVLALGASKAPSSLAGVTSVISLAALGLGLGGLTAWHGLRAWRGVPDAPFRLPRARGLALLFIVAVVSGQVVLSFGLAPRLLFPPLHVLAGALPAMTVFAFVGRRLGRAARQREMIAQVASGILIGGLGSIVLAGLAGLAIVVALIIFVAMLPQGVDILQSLLLDLQSPSWWENPDNLLSMIFTPVGLMGTLFLLVVVSPLIEEMLKPIGILFIRRCPGRAESFLWGLGGASGFALAEGMFNSAVDLDAWLPVVLMRIGTSLMHCLTGGLVGLGWYALRTDRRFWRAVGLYLGAVTMHGAWNALALGISGLSFASPRIGDVAANIGLGLLLGTLGLFVLVCTIVLVWLVRRLQAELA